MNYYERWEAITSLGSAQDTRSRRGAAYEAFYNLGKSDIAEYNLAGYEKDDGEPQEGTESNINIFTEEGSLSSATNVTFEIANSNENVGRVPINIEQDESPAVRVVNISLSADTAKVPVVVVGGGTETVTGSHKINLGDNNGIVYLGENATGKNKVIGGAGNVIIKHVGQTKATISGGAGSDSIDAGANDVVSGGAGADYFFDNASYTIKDYNATEGDVLVATDFNSIKDLMGKGNVHQASTSIGFGADADSATYINIGEETPNVVHVKVAALNDDQVTNKKLDFYFDTGNGTIDASTATAGVYVVAKQFEEGINFYNIITGSDYDDQIKAGAGDKINAGAGNDLIILDSISSAHGAVVSLSAGKDTVQGWQFGFDSYSGSTKFAADPLAVKFDVKDDKMIASVEGSTLTFADTENSGGDAHGQFNVLVGDEKYTFIRGGASNYAQVSSDAEVANHYVAQRNGTLIFTEDVKSETPVIYMARSDLKNLALNNNSKSIVFGSADRDNVTVGGSKVTANKLVVPDAGNDYIYSGGDEGAGHSFFFGVGDGYDTVENVGHYLGSGIDPGKQRADKIYIESYAGSRVRQDSDGNARIEIFTSDNDVITIKEQGVLDYNNKMYLISESYNPLGVAKIGYSSPAHEANNFTYKKEVTYYVGVAGNNAKDTLTVEKGNSAVDIHLDGSDGNYYRGIREIDASAVTTTRTTLAGAAYDEVIRAGAEGTHNYLWGANGNDTLYGGAGEDKFYYSVGDGNDVINNYTYGQDTIYLNDLTFDDVNFDKSSAGVVDGSVKIEFNDGGSVTVQGVEDKVKFHASDGTAKTATSSGWE